MEMQYAFHGFDCRPPRAWGKDDGFFTPVGRV
ncbi:hypothetical protein LMG9964_01031 [Paraburkholderia phenoliruptrix]|uniref:Uncharacterized protein n=1 Tax=Paraburkholderia phenoliruptrix TaxID=252970 RepID=A0A6J5JZP0_9BURK|nr:hypothetical protein [Paraburkholderia phenoliruptrix]CAB4047399.1 hypothetical protein LMG9964_01031 [Paraburkholderia phenoliruptrix]